MVVTTLLVASASIHLIGPLIIQSIAWYPSNVWKLGRLLRYLTGNFAPKLQSLNVGICLKPCHEHVRYVHPKSGCVCWNSLRTDRLKKCGSVFNLHTCMWMLRWPLFLKKHATLWLSGSFDPNLQSCPLLKKNCWTCFEWFCNKVSSSYCKHSEISGERRILHEKTMYPIWAAWIWLSYNI